MEFTVVLFYLFSLLAVVAAIGVIASRNPVYSVLWLIFAFFNAAGLFILLGAEMLAMLLVIVYVGAVAVLFLFVVMMLNIKTSSIKKGFQAYLPFGLLLPIVLFLEIALVITNSSSRLDTSKDLVTQAEMPMEQSEKSIEPKAKAEEVTKADEETADEDADEDDADSEVNTTSETPAEKPEEKELTNAHMIGNVLYTDYILYFQICGLILLVAMIGAIVLTLRHREGVRRQKPSEQIKRDPKKAIEIVKVQTGQGVE